MIDGDATFFPEQQQMPGSTVAMDPHDHGETSYRGSGRLAGKKAVITGGDSGIGRAIAVAFAREGADVLISYLNEKEDAQATGRLIEQAGRKAVLMPGDIKGAAHCRTIIEAAVAAFVCIVNWIRGWYESRSIRLEAMAAVSRKTQTSDHASTACLISTLQQRSGSD